jgi:lysophospholipid acyltransferase (LPLAT)-like uncharacterized protein
VSVVSHDRDFCPAPFRSRTHSAPALTRYNRCVSAVTPSLTDEPSLEQPPFTRWQDLLLTLIAWATYWAVRLIGPTLRFSVSCEQASPTSLEQRPVVYSFWHQCTFVATYLWRDLNIRVMSSTSFDGEFTARMIRRFGFVPVRGSSSRGAVRGLLGMRKEIEAGWTVAFTIDGPRGPRFVTKPGPVLLARSSGIPMAVFHIALQDRWILNTWDHLMIPKPFSRALMRVGTFMPVPADAGSEELELYNQQLQAALDRVKAFAEANVEHVGSPQLPIFQRHKRGGAFPVPAA